MCVERLACIQFERNDLRFKSVHATNFLTNRLQHIYISAVVCSENWTAVIGLHSLANKLAGWKPSGCPYLFIIQYSPDTSIVVLKQESCEFTLHCIRQSNLYCTVTNVPFNKECRPILEEPKSLMFAFVITN